jgi:hypothetical protein
LLAGSALTCGGVAAPDVETRTAALGSSFNLSISLPNTATAQRVALGAATNLTISDHSKVVELSGQISTVSSVGSEQTQFGVSTSVGNVWSKPSIFLQSNAVISGFLNIQGSITQQTGVSIAGPITQETITANSALTTWAVTFPTTGQNVQLQPSQHTTLAPGSYGSVSAASQAQIHLSTGTYYFTSFDFEPSAQLTIDETAGPVLLYIQSILLYKGTISHVGGGPGDFLMGCTACSDLSLQGPFSGTLVAPTANVTLTTVAGGHTGSFFANRITVNPNVTVTHQTFKHWNIFTSSSCPNTIPTTLGPFSLCNGGNGGRLPPAIDPTVSRGIVDAFRWPQAPIVANFGADGNPSLWYAWIYVQDKKDLEILDDLEIHWDPMPLFDVERDQWSGMTGVTTSNFDGEGGFVFAVIPGATYNIIREAALCSDPNQAINTFRAIVLQNIPVASAKNADGSLSYSYLATNGFRYRGLPNCPTDDQLGTDTTVPEAACDSPFLSPPAGGDPTVNAMKNSTTGSGLTVACSSSTNGSGSVQQPFGFHIGGLIKSIVSGAHSVVHGLSDLARKGLADVSKLFKGSTTLTVDLQVMNSDPGFGGPNTLMLRTWGANRGQPVPLPGVPVRALQQITFSFHPHIPSIKIPGTNISTPGILFPKVSGTIPFDSLATGTANAAGVASIKVVKDSATGICVELQNAAAQLNDWVTPDEACTFKSPLISASQLNGPLTVSAPLAQDEVNDLAQLSEAYTYLQTVEGYTPKQINVLTDFFANLISDGGRAYTPCFGYTDVDALLTAIGDKLGSFGGTFAGNKIETYFKDASDKTSEATDAWANAVNKWAAATQAAANTSAAQAVANANQAVIAASQASTLALTAAGAAAEAAATLTEAGDKLSALQSQGGSSQAIADAQQAVTNDVNALKTASDALQQAEQSASTASNAALAAVQDAYTAAAQTVAANAAAVAADATRLAGSALASAIDTVGKASQVLLPMVGAAVGSIIGFIVGEVADVVFDGVDMVLPPGFSTLSRGVTSHEYGHFSFCDMMFRNDPEKFSSVWVNAASDTIVSQVTKSDGAQVQDYFLNEGIADYFATQLAGGMNYFAPAGSRSASTSFWPSGMSDPMSWCSATNPSPLRCAEDNIGAMPAGTNASPNIAGTNTPKQVTTFQASDDFIEAVGTTTTTIHDVFDGWPNSPAVNEPGNGGAWVFLSSGEIRAPQPPFTSSIGFLDLLGSLNDTPENGSNPPIHEENISLPGTSFPSFIAEFLRREPTSGAMLEQQTLFGGLTQVMLNFGADPNEICRLYELHQPTDTCPLYGPASASSPPPPPLYVCPAGSTLTNGQCVSSITPPS